jgi:hypothetical protein
MHVQRQEFLTNHQSPARIVLDATRPLFKSRFLQATPAIIFVIRMSTLKVWQNIWQKFSAAS